MKTKKTNRLLLRKRVITNLHCNKIVGGTRVTARCHYTTNGSNTLPVTLG